jgi:uncharacterized protein (DUF1330 family)
MIMATYVILTREKTRDAAELAIYNKMAPGGFVGHDATFLVVHGRHEVLEGPATEDVMMVSFPSFEAAKAWHESPAYREACEHRFRGGDFRCIVVEGA